jgi:hypothetical protein
MTSGIGLVCCTETSCFHIARAIKAILATSDCSLSSYGPTANGELQDFVNGRVEAE